MIFRKVYVSRASHEMSGDEVEAILKLSRRNNRRDGLTGILIYHNKRFFQVLEGSLEALESCYARIEQDDRHTAMRLLAKGTAPDRAFPNWKMGYADPADLSLSVREGVTELTHLADASFDGRGDNERVHRLIDEFLRGFRAHAGKKAAS